MSVIVKGMKMPENCLHCDFDDSYGICACRNETPYVCEYSAKQRPSWCPLEEVPSAQPETHEKRTETHACDCISRQAAIDALISHITPRNNGDGSVTIGVLSKSSIKDILDGLPSAQPTLYGYNIEHLEMIARVLQKENLPPERVVEMLTDIGRIVAIIRDEFEDNLRKAVEQCMT